ncbi:MAG: hypothetical protein M1821_003066 [Bathelium mastoideum]|nr:MAG: hypothetical protein M1821_003066 [Bathelium mastoideum]
MKVQEAVTWLEECHRLVKDNLKEDHPGRLASQHELVMAYRADGQIKKAVALLEQVVTIKEKTLAQEHLDRLTSQYKLARMYRYELARMYKADGQIKKAVALLEHVVEVEKGLAEDHPNRLASQPKLYSSALQAALEKGYESVVHLLNSYLETWESTQGDGPLEMENRSLSPEEPLPSLTDGVTIESTREHLNKDSDGEPLMNHISAGDADSTVSALALKVSSQERKSVTGGFARAIIERIGYRQSEISMTSASQECIRQILGSKLKRYSKEFTQDTPKSVEFVRKRNAAKNPADIQQPDDDVDFYQDMEYEKTEGHESSLVALDTETIRTHLVEHRSFKILESKFQQVIKYYRNDVQ